MATNNLSPDVSTNEIDLTTVVPSVSTSIGAFAGVFEWGPVGIRTNIDSEQPTLLNTFGGPSDLNGETWFTIANFLGYSSAAVVVRTANTTGGSPAVSAISTANGTNSNNIFIANTTGIVNGMYVSQTSNSTIMAAGNTVTVTSVNSTAVTLSSNTTSNAAVELYFANPGTSYSALGLTTGGVVSNIAAQIVPNQVAYPNLKGTFDSSVLYIAKFPGAKGNSLRVAQCDSANSFQSNVSIADSNNVWTGSVFTLAIGSNTGTLSVANSTAGSNSTGNTYATAIAQALTIGDNIMVGNATIGTQFLSVSAVSNAVSNSTVSTVTVSFVDPYRLAYTYTSNTVLQRRWEFFNEVGTAPGQSHYVATFGNTAANDELHLVVVDNAGDFSGVPGSVLEVFKGLSRANNSQQSDTTTNYYVNVINQQSKYIWWANDRSGAASANATTVASSTNFDPLDLLFTLGTDGYTEASAPLGVIASGYDQFQSKEDVNVDIIIQGKGIGGTTSSGGLTVSNYLLTNYIIDNLVTQRLDCIASVSPDSAVVVNNVGYESAYLVAWRNVLHSTSYATMDSGYKYQYDRYNDVYRWIPLNGDIAGLMARTDQTNASWWSPAGYNRGQIKNLVKLAYNPKKPDRDILYPNGINPVVSVPGEGTILLGDKTLQTKPSAFDRINVRRLFITLEKAISKAAKFSLFEFNDSFTQNQFVNLVTPYLRAVQGARGITAFQVVCDSTNNTPEIMDTDQFVGDIYIKPARSINWIQLNFVAVGTGVQFSEVVGKF